MRCIISCYVQFFLFPADSSPAKSAAPNRVPLKPDSGTFLYLLWFSLHTPCTSPDFLPLAYSFPAVPPPGIFHPRSPDTFWQDPCHNTLLPLKFRKRPPRSHLVLHFSSPGKRAAHHMAQLMVNPDFQRYLLPLCPIIFQIFCT